MFQRTQVLCTAIWQHGDLGPSRRPHRCSRPRSHLPASISQRKSQRLGGAAWRLPRPSLHSAATATVSDRRPRLGLTSGPRLPPGLQALPNNLTSCCVNTCWARIDYWQRSRLPVDTTRPPWPSLRASTSLHPPPSTQGPLQSELPTPPTAG